MKTNILYGSLIVAIAGIFYLLVPYPVNNDFFGLARLLYAIDSDWTILINDNWGFAHVGSHFLISKLSQDLFLSHRLLATIGCLIFAFAFLKMNRNWVKNKERQMLAILLLLVSPFFLMNFTSVHLDIIPAALLLIGLLLISKKGSKNKMILAGLVFGLSYWFRFHFLPPAMALPFLLLIDKETINRKINFRLCLSTALITLAIPHLISLIGTGQFGFGNTKMILSQAGNQFSWDLNFLLAFHEQSVHEIFTGFDWRYFFDRIVQGALANPIFSVYMIITQVLIGAIWVHRNKLEQSTKFLGGALAIIMMSFVILICIRGFNVRLLSAYYILSLPLLFGLFEYFFTTKQIRYASIALLLLFAFSDFQNIRQLFDHRKVALAEQTFIESNIPANYRKEYGEINVDAAEILNHSNPYYLFSPIIIGGWPALDEDLVRICGSLDLQNLEIDKMPPWISHIIVRKNAYFNFQKIKPELSFLRLENAKDQIEIWHIRDN